MKKNKFIILPILLSSIVSGSLGFIACTQAPNPQPEPTPKPDYQLTSFNNTNKTQTSLEFSIQIANLSQTDQLKITLNNNDYDFLVSNLTKLSGENQFQITINNLSTDTEYNVKEIKVNNNKVLVINQNFRTLKAENSNIIKTPENPIPPIITDPNKDKDNSKPQDPSDSDKKNDDKVNQPQDPKDTDGNTKTNDPKESSSLSTIIDRITKTSASVIVTFDQVQPTSIYKLVVTDSSNQEKQYSSLSIDGNLITFKLDNLTPGLNYQVKKMTVNLPTASEYNINQSFKTKNEESFEVKNIELKEVLDSEAKIRVNFTTSILEDQNNQNYDLTFINLYGDIEKTNLSSTNKLITDESGNYIEFLLSNLQFSSFYQLKNLYINNKNYELNNSQKAGDKWKNESALTFETSPYSKPITYESIGLTFTSEQTASGTSDKAYLSLEGLNNQFEINEEYVVQFSFKDKESQKEFSANLNISKQKYHDFKNFEFTLFEVSDWNDLEGFTFLPKNKNVELIGIGIDTKKYYEENTDDANSKLRIQIKPANGKTYEFSTNSSYDNYDQSELTYDKNTKLLKVTSNITMVQSSNQPTNVQFVLSSDYGASWTLPATKENDKWSAKIDNLDFNGKIFLSKVKADNKDIRPKSSTDANKEVTNNQDITQQNLAISSISTTNNNKSTVTINFSQNLPKHYLSNVKPIFVYYEEGNENNVFEAHIQNASNNQNSLSFETYLKPNVNYKVKYLFYNNQYLKTETTFKREKYTSTSQLDIQNQWTNIKTTLELNQKWWASAAKRKIIDKATLLSLVKDININYDDEVDFIIETSYNSYDDAKGNLQLKIKISYKDYQSDFKTFTVSNLFTKNDFNPNNSTIDLNNLIWISEQGLSKSTGDFDKKFGAEYDDKNDLSYSFGNKTKWIDLQDPKLNQFVVISERFKNYDDSKFMLYFTKFTDVKDVYKPHKTSPYAMYGMLNYRINAWFDSYNKNNKNAKPEIKYALFTEPALITGYNNYSQKEVTDYLTYLETHLIKYSKTNWDEFNKTYGFNDSSKGLSPEDLKEKITSGGWNQLLKYTNLERLLTRLTYFVKNAYNPVITNELHAFNIINVETVKLGDNSYLRINFNIKAILSNSKNFDNVLNTKALTLDFLIKK